MTRGGIVISVDSLPLLMPFAWRMDSLLRRKALRVVTAKAMKENLEPYYRKSLITLRPAVRTAEQPPLTSKTLLLLHQLKTILTRWTRQRWSTQTTSSSQTRALSVSKCSRLKTLQLKRSNTIGNPINQSLLFLRIQRSPRLLERDYCRKETLITSQEVKFWLWTPQIGS